MEDLNDTTQEQDENLTDDIDDVEDDINEENDDDLLSQYSEFDDEIDDGVEDDDDPNSEAADDVDEEDKTDEDLEDEDERNALQDLLEQDPNAVNEDEEEEEVTEEDLNIDDRAIADAMWKDPDYSKYMEQAEDDGVEMKDDFAAMMARNRIDAGFLMERSIYTAADFKTHIQSLEEKVDPEAVILPREDDEEGWQNLETTYLGVPESEEGYEDDIFHQTYMEGNEEEIADARQMAHGARLNAEQAEIVINWNNAKHEAFVRDMEQDQIDYKKSSQETLKATFGNEYKEIMKDVSSIGHKYGGEWFKEFKNTKAANSANLVMMLYNAMNDISNADGVSFKGNNLKLSTISDERLDKIYDDLLEHKYSDETYQGDSDKRIAKIAKKVALRINAVDAERRRRGR